MNDGLKHAKSSMFTPLTMVSPLSSLQTRNLPERRSPVSRQSPFRVMNTAEYLRIHANAHPSKLRHIVKNKIFLTDNVEYLKRLVNDIGMDYVFRFLWYDGSAPSEASQWNNATVGSASKHNSSSSMPGNNASSVRGPRDSSVKLPTSTYTENGGGGSSSQRGRTWIQYCCYYNAHKCLQWIFGEIIRNYLHQQQQERHLSMDEKMGNDNVEGNQQHSNVKDEEEEQIVDEVEIIRQLLESPLPNYCGTNYVAVGEHNSFFLTIISE